MFRRFTILATFILVLLTTPRFASAQDKPDEFLVNVSNQVLEVIKDNRESYNETPDLLEMALLETLEPAVDFNAFSRGVMGRYYKEATPQQRENFVTAFKATLIELYTQGLVSTEVEDIRIEDTNIRSDTSATVTMEVTSKSENSYSIQYSLRKDEVASWKIRNIIANGVNVGLTYRNQFKSAMETENGNLERVIEIWPQIIGNE
ncbi:MAG: ABC transporter substrate-binding protein [Litorimonas sp.]